MEGRGNGNEKLIDPDEVDLVCPCLGREGKGEGREVKSTSSRAGNASSRGEGRTSSGSSCGCLFPILGVSLSGRGGGGGARVGITTDLLLMEGYSGSNCAEGLPAIPASEMGPSDIAIDSGRVVLVAVEEAEVEDGEGEGGMRGESAMTPSSWEV